MILVTGATGNLGETVVDHLLTKVEATQIVAFARDMEKAASLIEKGVEVRQGDFDDVASLEAAMNGISKVFLVSAVDPMTRVQQHKNVIDAAKKAGVEQLVYTSSAVQDTDNSPLAFMLNGHFETEAYLKASGVPYTILRNTLYADSLPQFTGEQVFETGVFLPIADGKVPFALRREMGEAAAEVMLQPNHLNKTYTLTASQYYTFEEIAQMYSEIAGKEVGYVNADPVAYQELLQSLQLPDFLVAITTGFTTDMREGRYTLMSDDFEMILGRKPMTLKECLKEIYKK